MTNDKLLIYIAESVSAIQKAIKH